MVAGLARERGEARRPLEEEAAEPLLLIAARGDRATLHNRLLGLENQELKTGDLIPGDDTTDCVNSDIYFARTV